MRRYRWIAAVVALGTALTACATGNSGGGSATSVRLYNDKGAWSPQFKSMAAVGKKTTGIDMSPVGYTEEQAYEAFIKASFSTSKKPDLFTWSTGGRLAELVDAHQVADTSSVWKDQIAQGNLSSGIEKYYTVDGRQYCVPLEVSYWVMFYNKHVFEKYNLTPPKTWADMMSIAGTLKSNGVTPFYETSTLFTFVWFEQMLAGSDPDLYARLNSGKASYTDPGVVAVMKEWKSMIDKGYMSNPTATDQPDAMLSSGKVAMLPFGTFFNSSLAKAGMKPGTDYDFFVIPNLSPQLSRTSLILETGPLCSPANAKHPEAARKYSTWWVSQQAQSKWTQLQGDVSANPKVQITEPALETLSQDAGSDQYELVMRYFEAAPAPVLTDALDAFGAFMVKPGSYQKVLSDLEASNQKYWSAHGGSGD